MEWFNRYEYEQDPKKFWKKIRRIVLDILALLVVIPIYIGWKFSSHIDWELFKDITVIKYILLGIVCFAFVAFAVIKGSIELIIWTKNNKGTAKRYLIWIIGLTLVLFAFCTLLAKLIINNNHHV